jgi:hypothetical protein
VLRAGCRADFFTDPFSWTLFSWTPGLISLALARLGIEAQRVIALRMMRLAGGGALARREAWRMMAEKSAAPQPATTVAAVTKRR